MGSAVEQMGAKVRCGCRCCSSREADPGATAARTEGGAAGGEGAGEGRARPGVEDLVSRPALVQSWAVSGGANRGWWCPDPGEEATYQ
jgi:hypothetical protein